jgi:hypothetical protein
MNYLKRKNLNLKICNLAFSVRIYRIIQVFIVSGAFFLFPCMSAADSDSIKNSKGIENADSIKQELRSRYEIDKILLKQGPDGPVGPFRIQGDITPPGVVESDPRSIARSFLIEEASLFGISNIDEDIRESSILTDPRGQTHIIYHRYVNDLKLDGMEIGVHLRNDDTIFLVNGSLVPVTSSLINTINEEEGLSKEEIAKVIKDDLGLDGIYPETVDVKKLKKIAVASGPYVAWEAGVVLKKGSTGSWTYTIDAFTGKVIEKIDHLGYFRSFRQIDSQTKISSPKKSSPAKRQNGVLIGTETFETENNNTVTIKRYKKIKPKKSGKPSFIMDSSNIEIKPIEKSNDGKLNVDPKNIVRQIKKVNPELTEMSIRHLSPDEVQDKVFPISEGIIVPEEFETWKIDEAGRKTNIKAGTVKLIKRGTVHPDDSQ